MCPSIPRGRGWGDGTVFVLGPVRSDPASAPIDLHLENEPLETDRLARGRTSRMEPPLGRGLSRVLEAFRQRMHGRSSSLILLSGVALLGSCGPERSAAAAAIQVEDDSGRTVLLDAPPDRIVSLIPSITETIVALGARDLLVARTQFDRGEDLAHLPSLGGGLNPNPEAVAGLRPDLLVSWRDSPDSDVGASVTGLGIPVYRGETQSLEDHFRTIERMGVLLGREEQAGALMARTQKGLDAVRASVAGKERPTVLYVVWHDPAQVAGPGTYLDSLISIAGGQNAFADAPLPWPQVSLEEVVARDPDFVLAAGRHDRPDGSRGWLDGPGWRDLTAAAEGRVLEVEADLFNRPGPRVTEAAALLAEILHGVNP